MTALVQTSVAIQIAGVIETLREHRFNGAVIGAAGLGKTHAVQAIARATPATAIVTGSEALGKKPNLLWQQIAWELGIVAEESAAETEIMLRHHNFTGHVLIIDEAQQLPPVQIEQVLKTLGNEHNDGRLSVVLCGNAETLHRSGGRKAGWQQIETRLAIVHPLEGIGDEDVVAIAGAYGVRHPDALTLLRAIGERQGVRGVVYVLQAARRSAGELGAIDASVIRKILQPFPKYRPANVSTTRRSA